MPRESRRERNQRLFRDVNERIAGLATKFSAEGFGLLPDDTPQRFICECATIGCSDGMTITLGAYARARANADAFLVVAGHEDLNHEQVIAKLEGSVVVVVIPKRVQDAVPDAVLSPAPGG